MCGTIIPQLGKYCPTCGAIRPSMRYSGLPEAGNRRAPAYGSPYYYKNRTDWRRIIKAIAAFVMIVYLFQLAFQIVTLVWGAKLVVPDILETWSGVTLFVIMPIVVDLLEISGYTLVVYYYSLIAAIVASCLWIFLTSFSQFTKEARMRAESRRHSALFDTLGLFFATLFFSVLIALLVQPSSDEVPSPTVLSDSLFLLANASVWEELVTRVLLIGVPLLAWALLRSSRKNRIYSYFLGGGFKMNLPEVTLILVSSVIFGFAHFEGGWGAWKIVPTTAAGLAFGYLFLKHGLAAAIMMHFATDYLALPLEAFYSFALEMILGLGVLLWLAFGAVFFVYYTTRMLEFVTGRKYFEFEQPQPSPGVQAAYGYPPSYRYAPVNQQPWPLQPEGAIPPPAPESDPYRQSVPQSMSIVGRYVCPACGHTEARWVNGRFQCLRCGNLS
ncbi:MAG: CPBP family glutamic-type intramembrane protease [Thermoplasmata archaeon]|nr:CPBP family glutamic-type intramembrane protease [Thermoplasmata archaeon]